MAPLIISRSGVPVRRSLRASRRIQISLGRAHKQEVFLNTICTQARSESLERYEVKNPTYDEFLCDYFPELQPWAPKRDGHNFCKIVLRTDQEEPLIQYRKIQTKLGWGRDGTLWLAKDNKVERVFPGQHTDKDSLWSLV